MTSRREVTPTQAGDRARTAVRSRLRGWLTDPVAAQTDSLNVALHPPTERRVAEDPDRARDWARSWRGYRGPGVIDWESRHWSSFGTQDVPVRLRLSGVSEISRAAGQRSRWDELLRRRERLVVLSTASDFAAAVAATVPRWEPLADNDFQCLVATVGWLLAHPDSGLLIRQLPIEGVDTKWLGTHRRLVEKLIKGARGSTELGIRTLPSVRELVLLDPGLLPGMPSTFFTTLDGLASLPIVPSTVLILENREGVHALPPIAGAVALPGGGNAVTDLADIAWVRGADVVYWGDLDTHGLTILDRLRRRLPHVRSVLMDPQTLSRWRHLAVPEPSPATEDLVTLTDSENDTLLALRAGGLRLEQERIPWPAVLDALAAVGVAS